MERRVLLAIFLSFVVLYVYQSVFVPPQPPPAVESNIDSPQDLSARPVSEPPAPQTPITPELAPSLVSASEVREVVVDAGKVRAVFTNRGGRLTKWLLRDYTTDNGEPLNLIPSGLEDQQLPFSLQSDDETTTLTLNSALYQIEGGGAASTVDATTAPATLTFEYQDTTGLEVRKEYRFTPDSYTVEVVVQATQNGIPVNVAFDLGPGLSDSGSLGGEGGFFSGMLSQAPQAIFHTGDDVERVGASSIDTTSTHEAAFRFVGIDDHYFVVAVIEPGASRVDYKTVTLPPLTNGQPQRELVAYQIQFPDTPPPMKVYFGPKLFDELQRVDDEFVRAINFGIFAWLVVPLLGALNWIYGFVGNYGVSIITLTILINLAISPLRHKSMVSMRKMQALGPRIKAIQDRYKDLKFSDPARGKMNSEVMAVYRENGTSPASGCLPMLLTMPVLFSFYSLLGQAVEIRGAEFGLWVHDLSQKDPYYITPLLMGATMFWQQRITPTTVDATQQKVMLAMPVMFTFLFLSLPSGLVLYWFVSNLCAIGQQYFTNRMIGTLPVPDQRVKNIGSGRTNKAKKSSKP